MNRERKIIDNTLGHEGGYTTKPNETYCGIDIKYHPNWRGWKLIDEMKKNRPIKYNEKFIELDSDVYLFYHTFFYSIYRIEEIGSLADLVFDLFVNHSPDDAAKIIQRALNSLGAGVIVDGVMGSKTISALNSLGESARDAIVDERIKFYRSLKNKKQFLDGWLIRAEKFRQGVL